MPSRLVTSTLSRLGASGAARQRLKAAVAAVTQGVQTVTARGPFLGFQPDVDPNLADGTAFTALTNVLARAHGEDHGEVLGLPDGYRQVDNTTTPALRLPLGDGSTLPAAPLTDAKPVVRIDGMDRTNPTGGGSPGSHTGEWQVTPLVVTAGDGTNGGSGNMYRIDSSGTWVQVPADASMTAARQLAAGRDGPSGYSCMPDSCVAPFGATARAAVGGAGADGQSGAIQEPCWIFTNYQDEVMVFPSSSGDTLGGTHAYEPLTSVAALDGGGANGFRARSVETWNGRVYFLNTTEAATRRTRRLRRTARFTADPDPAIVGSGFWDFPELQGEGLRIETLGDLLGVYFQDGIVFMRATGVPTAPDEPQVLSTERGLLATHAMCAMGRNVHFLITTDGWWLLDQSGRFQELGVVNLDGKIVPKWRQTFYEGIPSSQRHRLYCYYDQPNNLVYIARPTFTQPDPQEVWIYDPTSDRVFIENYPVTCFGSFTPLAQAGVQIDAAVGTIDAASGTIDSTAPIAGFPKARIHGDLLGYVYAHRRDVVGYDSATQPPVVQDPSWLFSTGLRSPGGFRNQVTVDRVSLEYFNHLNTNTVSVEVRGPAADGSQTRNVQLNGGNHEDVRSRDAWFRYTSQAPGLRVSGSGEFHIRSLAVDLFSDGLEPRGL